MDCVNNIFDIWKSSSNFFLLYLFFIRRFPCLLQVQRSFLEFVSIFLNANSIFYIFILNKLIFNHINQFLYVYYFFHEQNIRRIWCALYCWWKLAPNKFRSDLFENIHLKMSLNNSKRFNFFKIYKRVR